SCRSLASSGTPSGKVMFLDCASCCNSFKALLWSSTIILANRFTFMSVVLLVIILPSSTSARLPLAASLMKCWSGLELLAADELLVEALLAGAPVLSLLAAGAELFSGVAALLLLLVQPAANRPRPSRDIKRLFFIR